MKSSGSRFTFSAETAIEDEDYCTQLGGITDLKLTIMSDISGGNSRATLRALRIR